MKGQEARWERGEVRYLIESDAGRCHAGAQERARGVHLLLEFAASRSGGGVEEGGEAGEVVRGARCIAVGRSRWDGRRGRGRRHQAALCGSPAAISRRYSAGATTAVIHHAVAWGSAARGARRAPQALRYTRSVGGCRCSSVMVVVVMPIATHPIRAVHTRLRGGMRRSGHHDWRNY